MVEARNAVTPSARILDRIVIGDATPSLLEFPAPQVACGLHGAVAVGLPASRYSLVPQCSPAPLAAALEAHAGRAMRCPAAMEAKELQHDAPDHGALHGALRPSQYRGMKSNGDWAATGGGRHASNPSMPARGRPTCETFQAVTALLPRESSPAPACETCRPAGPHSVRTTLWACAKSHLSHSNPTYPT